MKNETNWSEFAPVKSYIHKPFKRSGPNYKYLAQCIVQKTFCEKIGKSKVGRACALK